MEEIIRLALVDFAQAILAAEAIGNKIHVERGAARAAKKIADAVAAEIKETRHGTR